MALNYLQIGARIRKIRKKKGYSQAELSEMIDCSPTYISYIENGIKCMSLDTFVSIANALNTTADEILMDNLENTIKVSNHEFVELLADSSEYERRLMLQTLSALKIQSEKTDRTFILTGNNYIDCKSIME